MLLHTVASDNGWEVARITASTSVEVKKSLSNSIRQRFNRSRMPKKIILLMAGVAIIIALDRFIFFARVLQKYVLMRIYKRRSSKRPSEKRDTEVAAF